MRALILVALLGCSATTGPSRAAWGLDLAGIVASGALMPQAFEIDDRPRRVVSMSALFAGILLFGWSAKSVMRPAVPHRRPDGYSPFRGGSCVAVPL